MSAVSFFHQVLQDPVLALTAGLVLSVMLVNGWTDAPNAIATAVATGALLFRRAAGLAAACNLLGAAVTAVLFPAVAETLYTAVDLDGGGGAALSALCAALCAVVLWAVLAWRFGVPTSESHALAAGLAGAALALPGGLSNLRGEAWGRIALGLVLSLALGGAAGRWWGRRLTARPLSTAACRRGQIAGAAAMAFLHGAQDGQKFLGVFLLGVSLAGGGAPAETFSVPLWLTAVCAAAMSLGTAFGGRRIIDTLGRDMVSLSPGEGLAADLGGGLCLLLCTLAGLPVSTTHAKTAAILGAGSVHAPPRWEVAARIALTWLCTFPGCGLLGFLLARLFHPGG